MDQDDLTEKLFTLCKNIFVDDCNSVYESIKSLQVSTDLLSSVLIDVLVAIEVQAETDKNAENKQKLIEFSQLISDKLIPRDVLAMELDCLEAATMANKQQLVRLKTRLYFKQSKFNLLREESEGYAKLITELLEAGSTSSKDLQTRLLCLIGQFNLDPNRVTDIVMECFEHNLHQKNAFITLLKDIKANGDYLCTLLGFKYTFYQGVGKMTPFSLYSVTAAMIQVGLIDLTKVMSFMQPNADGIKETHKARAANASARTKKAETIMTTSLTSESSRSGQLETHNGNDQNIVGIGFATVVACQDKEDDSLIGEHSEEHVLGTNQKLGLICALLEHGEWTLAKQIIDRLPEYYAVQASRRVCKALSQMVDHVITDFYREKCSKGLPGLRKDHNKCSDLTGLSKVTSWAELAGFSEVLWYLGPRLAYSTITMIKLLRLITNFFQEKENIPDSDTMLPTFFDIVDEVLLPGLSLNPSAPNAAISEEMWLLLQLFPYQWRFRLYGRWKTVHSFRHSELSISRGKIYGRTRYVLKRLSKDTVKVIGRQLGKLCHIQPITVFDYLLSQIQSFDNLIQPVVESIKFLTNLEFDILAYCIIDQLANPDKQQLKSSDGNISSWLQALATLIGAVCKKYTVDLAGILNYVANQLKNEKSFDLIILREIIQNMSSVESIVCATQDHLDALQGGEVLRLEAGGFSSVRNKRASGRLKDALLEGDLAVGVCILIAQQRECIIHNDSSELPLKLIGEMVDQSRDTFMQFGTFIQNNLKFDEYSKRMPLIHDLMNQYNVPLESAAFLSRSIYMQKIIQSYDETKKERKLLEAEGKQKLDIQQKFLFFKSAVDTEVDQLIVDIKPCISEYVCNDIPMKLFVVFWLLSLYDIDVPTQAYDKAVESIRKSITAIDENMGKSRRQKEEDRLKTTENKLKEEQRKQSEHVERVRMWLTQERENLFGSGRAQQTIGFLQRCIIPRALFSELDAVFCAKIVILFHQQRTTFFQTLVFIDKTFNDILPLISGLTENETASFGRFLEMILSKTLTWHADKAVFDKECAGFPGFTTRVSGDPQQDGSIQYDGFRKLCFKWQSRLSQVVNNVLAKEKNDYIPLRNTLILMSKMTPCFPIIREHSTKIEEAALRVRDWEKGTRDDLSLKAASYVSCLKRRSVKMYDREHFSPMDPAKIKAAKPSQEIARKRQSTAPANDVKKKSAKIEKVETADGAVAEEAHVEVKREEKSEKETEDGEVPPSPPPKKVRD
ncbi:unnamed protein product [Auanema sp. JU1783]|nr:unnamed protein product [Auanema sp. JU1783]